VGEGWRGFRAFVTARPAALLRMAFLLTGDWQHAEDVLQTALMRCYGGGHGWTARRRTCAAMVITVTGWRRRWVGEVPTGAVPDTAVQDPAADVVVLRADLLRPAGRFRATPARGGGAPLL
jgi:DNA-directed RNA polymerase specialized sigma24 family protein